MPVVAAHGDPPGISYAYPYRDERGWRLKSDGVNGFEFLAEAYEENQPCPNLWGCTRTRDSLNPKRIIPRGPLDFDFTAPHGRG